EPPTPSAQRSDVHVAHLVTKNLAVLWMRTGETYASMNAAPTKAMQQKASTSPVATTCCGRLMSRSPNSTRVADEERLSVAAPAELRLRMGCARGARLLLRHRSAPPAGLEGAGRPRPGRRPAATTR